MMLFRLTLHTKYNDHCHFIKPPLTQSQYVYALCRRHGISRPSGYEHRLSMVFLDSAPSLCRIHLSEERPRRAFHQQNPASNVDWRTRRYVLHMRLSRWVYDPVRSYFLPKGASISGGGAYVRYAYSSQEFVRDKRIETAYNVSHI